MKNIANFTLSTLVLFLLNSLSFGAISYIHTDHLGSVVAESNSYGTVTNRYYYEPFGLIKPYSSAPTFTGIDQPTYTGHTLDEDTSLIYMKARFYDPEIGRFYSADPVGFRSDNPFSFNRYAYANNNPYRYIDPLGEDAVDVNFGFVGVTIGSDPASTNFFWKVRVGLAGIGAEYDPLATVPVGIGHDIPGECAFCNVTSLEWTTVNVSAGLTFGPLSWEPIEVVSDIRIEEFHYNRSVGDYTISGSGFNFDLFNFSSAFDPDHRGKFGFNISTDANYEFGGSIEWSSFRSFFGLDTLGLDHTLSGF